eukprot:4999765-Heterocapsa_arctica.AAC.1
MAVIVMHKNLPAHRSCTKSKTGKQLTMAETATNCGGKHCITCKGKMEGCQMLDTQFDIETSTAIANYAELKEHTSFKEWTAQENIEKLSS